MTREEAIHIIEKDIQIDVQFCTNEDVRRFEDALYMAIAALREQPRWISVEERMPEDGIRVLALHDDGVVRIGISRGYFPAVVSKTSTKTFGIAEVTHWMPLPEPPEEEV